MKCYIGFRYDRDTGRGSIVFKRSLEDAGTEVGSCDVNMDDGEPKGMVRGDRFAWFVGENDALEVNDEG